MVFSGNINLTKKTFQLSKYYQWWEDNQKKSGFVNSGFVLAADEREKTTYFHHWFYFFTWFNTEFDPHLLKYSLFSFFFTQTLFFSKHTSATRNSCDVAINFFLERHSSMCSRMVGLLIRTEKPNSGPKQHCCLPTPLSRTIQNIAVVATCGHCGPT